MKNLKRIFLFAFCFLATVVLVGCSGTGTPADVVTETEARAVVNSIKDKVAFAEGIVVEDNVTLQTVFEEAPDAIVEWATSNEAVISKTGVVTRPLYEDGNAVVTLSVTITVPYNQNDEGQSYYGRVQETYTFDVTVKCMPYVPTDEEVANGYLAEVADLSGEYKESITLPSVTNGVWSISGDLEIVDGVVQVQQTAEVQTATLTVTVTVGTYVGTKSFTITVPALITLHYYNSENWANVYVYEWSADPVVAWPGTKVDVVDGWVHYTPSYDPTGYNYIFNDGVNDSGKQTPDISYDGNTYFYGMCGVTFATAEEALAHQAANKTVLYIRGLNGDWGTSNPLTENNGVYTITIELKETDTFKIATADWSTVVLGWSAIEAVAAGNFTDAGGNDHNIKVVNAGTYTITATTTAITSVVKQVNETEEAEKIMATVTLPATCETILALPTAEGLTWAVKSGTAITVSNGVATVTQTDAEQVVVLTATVVYGNATVTKDFTVTVLPLEPTDEEIANGYLAAVEDLSGEYTENVTLPVVTSGAWTATGAEINEGVLVITQTTEAQNITLTLTVTVGEYTGTRTFTITVPAKEVVTYPTLHYYNSGDWEKIYIYEFVNGNPLVAWPGTEVKAVDGWVHYELSYNPTGYGYIFTNGSGSQTIPDIIYDGNNYFYGVCSQGFATAEEAIAHYQSTLETTINLYVKGDFNGWGIDSQFKLQPDGTYAVTVNLTAGQGVKVVSSTWGVNEHSAAQIVPLDSENFEGSGTENAMVINTGTYKFVSDGSKLTGIERIYDDNEEVDKILAAISLPEQVQASLVLPEAVGLTWSVKEGTAITISDGVATVVQGDTEQVVVLTATATFRSVTKTQDYTITVLPAEISDEEQAQIYLDEVVNVTGTYKTGFDLQQVTNGVWSVSGNGATIEGDSVVITRASADQTATLTITVTVGEVVLTKEFTLTIPKIGNMLYMKPNTNWVIDNARFAAYFFGAGEKWVDMVDSDGDGVYEVEIPAGGYTSVIFCRMSPSATANNWNNKWNQTQDLTISGNIGKTYTIKAGTWDKGGGTWA